MSDEMITVKMPLDDVKDMRRMLAFEKIMAEDDYEKVADLHNGSAVGVARTVLYTEIEKFSRIIGFIDKALDDLTEKFRTAGVLGEEEEHR